MMKAQLQKSGKDEDKTTQLIHVTMNKILGQFMIHIMKAVQRAKDEAVFCTSGGKLVYTTMTSRSCSVKDVFLDDFEHKKDAKKGNATNNSWTFTSLLRKYEIYASASNKNGTEWKNFYTWASEDSVRNKEIIPSFLDTNNVLRGP